MKTKTLITLTILFFIGAGTSLHAQTTLTPLEELGKEIYFDKIASPDNMSCDDCHGLKVGFTGPTPSINKHGAVYRGAVRERFGNRKPPSAAYATLSPIFHYDETEGIFVGGNFWDGRATGEVLGNPAADQAMGPFLNPVEHNNATKEDVLTQIANSKYAYLWQIVWGEPISTATQGDIDANYDNVGLSIAAYEASSEVNQFTSKYDYYLQGMVSLTDEELLGLSLFNDPAKGNCAACHPSALGSAGELPLFTDFTFDNLGAPKNPENPFYDMDEVYINGNPINPLGDEWIDYGLGRFLETHSDPAWEAMAADNMGKFKVPTLRNVDKRPGNGFPKAYLHNGVFKSLKEVVHFYNTRDVETWPPPEVAANVNTTELGNLGLSDAEEDAIVAFLATLSDGYDPNKSATVPHDEMEEANLKIGGKNPFSDNTLISYSLAVEATVELAVYSMNGEKVRTLVSSVMTAGDYDVAFTANDLPAGVYIICLNTGIQVVTEKVLLVK